MIDSNTLKFTAANPVSDHIQQQKVNLCNDGQASGGLRLEGALSINTEDAKGN